METEKIVEIVNKVMKGVYNLGMENFVRIMSSEASFKTQDEYESHFYRMRTDFFQWWCSVSENVQKAFVRETFR